MGEYALYRGDRIKIGTCESMYYLRADQAHLVTAESGNVDPVKDAESGIRFRFPFPDEDTVGPGEFEDYNRGVKIPGDYRDDYAGHYSVQFSADPGYLVSLPCPEQFPDRDVVLEHDGATVPLKIHRNGWRGGVEVQQQRQVNGELLTVIACGSCSAAWRLPTLEHAAPVAAAFRAEAERKEYQRHIDGWDFANGPERRRFLELMAERIETGYFASALPRTESGVGNE